MKESWWGVEQNILGSIFVGAVRQQHRQILLGVKITGAMFAISLKPAGRDASSLSLVNDSGKQLT